MSLRLHRDKTEHVEDAARSRLFVWLRALLVLLTVVALPADLVNPAIQSAVASEFADGEPQEYLDEKEFADGISGAIVPANVMAAFGAGARLQLFPAGAALRQKCHEPFGARDPPGVRI